MSSQKSNNQRLLEHYARLAPHFISNINPDGTLEYPQAKYIMEKVLGSGASGVVVRSRYNHPDANPEVKYAVKVVDLEGKKVADQQRALSEVKCLMSTNFFSALRCYDECTIYAEGDDPASENARPKVAIMVLDYADAGDLREEVRIRFKQRRPFQEHEAGLLFVQLVMAVHHIHNLHMIHRDIKSANILLLSNGIIKLGDFGFSKMFQGSVSDNVGGTFCGTPYYVAPEVWRGKRYSKKADMFSLGVLLYELLMLERPFTGDTIETVMHAVLNGAYTPLPDSMSVEMRTLCVSLLDPDPEKRPSTSDVLQAPIVKLFINAFSQIVQRPEFDPTLQKRIVDDMEVVRTSLTVPELTPEAMQAIVAQAGLDQGSTDPASGDNADGIIFGGMLLKKSSDGKWKKRYLCICRDTSPEAVAQAQQEEQQTGQPASTPLLLKIGFSRDSLGQQSLITPMAQFEDVFPVPPKFAEEHGNAFALATISTAKKMTFVAPSPEALDAWLRIIRSVLPNQ